VSPVFPHLTDSTEIFTALQGKTKKIYFEGYNPKLGNWDDVKAKLDRQALSYYREMFFNKGLYDLYWKEFIETTDRLNRDFNFEIQYFIYPFDSYYSSG
jgi:hypothetical protein